MGQEEVIPSEERAYTNGPDLVGRNKQCLSLTGGFPDSSVGKESACNAGDPGSIPGFGKSPGEGKGYPLQYSGLENSMDSPWGRKESDTTEPLSLSLLTLYIS